MAYSTPGVFDVFARVLAGGFRESNYVRLYTAGQAMFGRPGTGSFTVFSPNANALDIEIVRANQKLAALKPRGMVGRFVGPGNHDVQVNQGTMFSRAYPLIEEEFNLGADQLNFRVIGSEGPYDNLTEADRLRILARYGYMELVRRMVRLQEVLAWQSLLLGVQSYQSTADTTVNIYDWRRNSANTVTPSHGWGNPLGVPLTDLDSICDQLLFAGKVMPNFAVFGGTVMNYFLANPQITTVYANKLYFQLLRFGLDQKPDPQYDYLVEAGLKPWGVMMTPKGYELVIFTYPYMYDSATLDGTQTKAKFFDDTKVLVGSTESRNDRYFGPPERLPLTAIEASEMMERFAFNPATPILPPNIEGDSQTVLPQMFYTDAYSSNDRKHLTMRMQGAPVFPTTQTDAWATLVVGTTS